MRCDRIFSLLLFSFVLLRTLFLSSLLMPFEGWDEYQHLAVARFIDEHGRFPTSEDPVPKEMTGFLCAHPHPDLSARQLAGLGARTYDGRVWREGAWTFGQGTPGLKMPLLYESQHGPVFYRVMVMLKTVLSVDSDLIWAEGGRILNCLLAALTAVIWFQVLSLFFRSGPLAVLPFLLCLAMASSSLFAYCHARVANDGLAVFLGSAALLVFTKSVVMRPHWKGPRFIIGLLYLGVVTGLAVMSKATSLVLLPVFAGGLLFVAAGKKAERGRAPAALAVFAVAYLAVAGPYHVQNLSRSGTVTGMVEAVQNSGEDRGIGELLAFLPRLEPYRVMRLFFYDQLHCGGWSYLRAPAWMHRGFALIVQACLLLLAVALAMRRSRAAIVAIVKAAPLLPLLLCFTWAGLLYHLLNSAAARGEILTNPWYAILAFPALVLLLLLGAQGLFSRGAGLVGLALAAIFSYAYYTQTFGAMLHHETGLLTTRESLEMIGRHHILLKVPLELGLCSEALFLGGLFAVTLVLWHRTAKTAPGR